MYEEYIEELEDKVEELEDKNLNNKAWKDFYADENIKLRKVNEQLQNNWNKLKKGLQSLFEFDEGVVSNDYLECVHDTLNRMQELEEGEDE